jgi:secondary thiamine-phosphate synthase enzyme
MKQLHSTITVPTRGPGFTDLTDKVQRFVRDSGIETGLLTLFLPHTSASLLIQENADPDVRRDFERFFARLVPDEEARKQRFDRAVERMNTRRKQNKPATVEEIIAWKSEGRR